MRVPTLALLGAFALAASAVSASAAPSVSSMPNPEISNIIPVAQRCGRGFHRNYRGFCVPDRAHRRYAYYPRYYRSYRAYPYYGGGNEFLNRPSPSDHVANWLNAQEARRNWGYWGY
jgi:hypothetical protein